MRCITREFIETAILAVIIFLVLQSSIQNFRVQGSSMDPTLTDDQYLIVNKLVYMRIAPDIIRSLLPFVSVEIENVLFPFHPPYRGEVIIFHSPMDPSRDFVKRVIGVPGDTVEIKRGEVFIRGQKLREPYLTHRDQETMESTTLKMDEYFVLGDNRPSSNDSRDWGTVPVSNIVGRAWVSYWPPGQWRTLLVFDLTWIAAAGGLDSLPNLETDSTQRLKNVVSVIK